MILIFIYDAAVCFLNFISMILIAIFYFYESSEGIICKMKLRKTSLAVIMGFFAAGANADSLESARSIERNINVSSAQSQKKIDKSAEATLSMAAEIEQLQEEVKNLTVYRDHLARLVVSQEAEADSLNVQIRGIGETRQGIVPLMYKMIDGLKVLVAEDKPVRREHRLARIAKLDAMMGQADVSDAEKYRRILEAYQIEVDYGTKLGIYQGRIELMDLDSIEADLLYLGRISLVARSLDGKRYWAWNDKVSGWQALDSQFAKGIDQAFAIASKQAAPGLISLPVSVNVESK
ncbi:TonB system biopolymer transport component [Photobacterium marinum]|uniref:TonB system biopolymer transport component n=2 Tax=Photobacterium marinum TaxID=1056511 RepID=L8JB22_9GAMM|nr:TonB system biopolymer transport component [Photobacterium marinum]